MIRLECDFTEKHFRQRLRGHDLYQSASNNPNIRTGITWIRSGVFWQTTLIANLLAKGPPLGIRCLFAMESQIYPSGPAMFCWRMPPARLTNVQWKWAWDIGRRVLMNFCLMQASKAALFMCNLPRFRAGTLPCITIVADRLPFHYELYLFVYRNVHLVLSF